MNWFRRFMMGRYGRPTIKCIVSIEYFGLMVNFFLKIPILSSLAMAIYLLAILGFFQKY